MLLVGPPGLGKTTLAQIVREELGVGLRTVAGPALERKGDMAAILTSLERRDVLFVDEIHRVNRAIEEILYPALEDFRLDIVVGQGPAARTLTLDLPPFTLVGATTRTGLLTTPLRDRFGMTFRLGLYEPDELASIVRRSAGILGVELDDEAAEEIAARSRGTPRVANRILRRVRDVAEVRHAGAITTEVAREALELLEVDERGLERTDRELLGAIVHKFGGGPVGLSTLAVALGEEPDTIEDVYEPYLLRLGFLQRTPRGRVVTELGREHVGATSEATGCSRMSRDLDARRGRPARRARRPDSAAWSSVFAQEHGLEQAEVRVELVDGRELVVSAISPDPGFGFLTFVPHARAREARQVIDPDRRGEADRDLRPDPRPVGFSLGPTRLRGGVTRRGQASCSVSAAPARRARARARAAGGRLRRRRSRSRSRRRPR